MSESDISGAMFHKSTRTTNNGGACVEVATNLPEVVLVRDSKDRSGPTLPFRPNTWAAFADTVRDGVLDPES